MEEIIDYSNPLLEKNLIVTFGDKFYPMQPLLIDILLKRAHVFRLTSEESLMEAKRLMDNVDRFEFIKDEYSSVGGYFDPDRRKVSINMNLAKTYKTFYRTLTHELFHVLSTHIKYYDSELNKEIIENCTKENLQKDIQRTLCSGILEDPPREDSYKVGIMEAFNEAATSLIVNDSRDVYTSKHKAYHTITFIPHLLSAAIGTSDRELIYASTQSADKLNEVAISKLSETQDKERAKVIMGSLSTTVEYLHDFLIGNKPQVSFSKVIEYKKSILEATICNTYLMAQLQINKDNRQISSDFLNELIVRYNKMDRVALTAVRQNFFLNYNKFEQIKGCKKEMMNEIFGVYVINELKDKITDNEILEKYTKCAKEGKIYELSNELKEKFNIDLQGNLQNKFQEYIASEKWKNCEYYRILEKEDINDHKKWNQEKDDKLVKDIYENRTNGIKKRSIKKFIKGFFSNDYTFKEVMGLALGSDYNIKISFSNNKMLEELENKYNFSPEIAEDLMQYIEENNMFLKETVNKEQVISQGKTDDRENLVQVFSEYYRGFTSLISYKNSFISDDLKMEDILSSQCGLERIQDYKKSAVKKYIREGMIEKDRTNDFNELVKDDEEFVQSQIKQLYVLSKMKNKGIYTPSEEDIINAKEGTLFEIEGKIDFESYFNEDEFQKAVKKHKKDTDRLIKFDLKKVSHFFRKKIKGEDVLLLEASNPTLSNNKRTSFIESLRVEESEQQEHVQSNHNMQREKDDDIQK